MNPAFIYVLHFDRQLSHAEHYVGCTHSLFKRLEAHANGAGSRLCRALIAEGINWRLGNLYTCTHTDMRRLERKLKDTHNTPRYCAICTETPKGYPGATPYPIDSIDGPTSRDQFAKPFRPPNVKTRLTTIHEPRDVYNMIFHIQQKEKDALGFIPVCGDGGIQRLGLNGNVAIVSANDEDIGYAAFTVAHDRSRVTVHQCCVRDDARLQQFGRALISLVAATHPAAELVAKVRDDLAANHFWQAIGFEYIRTQLHPTSKNKLNIYYQKPLLTQPIKLPMIPIEVEDVPQPTPF